MTRQLRSVFVFLALTLWACSSGGGSGGVAGTDSGPATADLSARDLSTPDSTGSEVAGVDAGDVAASDAGPVQACNLGLQPAADGPCSVEAGDDKLLLRGTLILPSGLLSEGTVLISGGLIRCAGCDCGARPEAAGATVVTCAQGVISPGLINAHDHISFTQMKPISHEGIRYDHRHEWRKGLNGKKKLSAFQNSNDLGDAWGEMRQVMAGTTSLFGSGGEPGFLRNLDRKGLLEGLSHDVADYSTFPLGDNKGTMADQGCGSYKIESSGVLGYVAYVPHVAEGIAASARNEFVCLSGQDAGGVDYVVDNAAFIHGIGVTTADIALMAADGTALVWSPRSNTDLYGMTAEAPLYDRLGVQIALGTDWTASGSIHILRELRCAESWNTTYWNGYFSDAQLVAMVTWSAADVLGFGDVLGSLVEGKVADVVIWDARQHPGYRAILDAGTTDVQLVLRGGTPLYGDPALMSAAGAGAGCETLSVCGSERQICAQREIGTTVAKLGPALGGFTYGLFFCSEPPGEPSCLPVRPGAFTGVPSDTDADGDGVPDGEDNCPLFFNPPRPLDGGAQTDADGDAVGDDCDPCPFDKGTSACTSVDPMDADGDGVINPSDNCPGTKNPDQADGDKDGTGDVCDSCPEFPNPGGGPCPGTIYAVKKGEIPVGKGVKILGALVIASGFNAAFITTDPASDDWEGPDFAATYVFLPDVTVPPVGARVNVEGQVGDFFGQTQIGFATVEVVETGVALPAPIEVTPEEVAPGGARAEALEAQLVVVRDVEVVDVAPAGQPGETVQGEFVLKGGLSVDDFIYEVSPFPQVGQVFGSITGVLRLSWNRNKLLPRSADDVSFGAPFLLSFGPAEVWIYEGEKGPSAPPVEVMLSAPVSEATFVKVDSSAPTILSVEGGGVTIPANGRKATVALDALAPGGPVTLMATFGGPGEEISLEAKVTVLDTSTVPVPVSLDPPTATVVVEQSLELTLTLDLPAPPAGLDFVVTSGGAPVEVPPSIFLPAGARSVSFQITAGSEAGPATVEVLGPPGSSASTALDIVAVPTVGLVLAEVFYNPTGGDDGLEWVRLYNGTASPIDLQGWSLGYGGSSYTYGTYALSGTIPVGGCLLVGGPKSSAANGDPVFDLAQDFDPDIQNGTSPGDGLALFHVDAAQITGSTVPVDAVIYGKNNSSKLIGPDGNPFPNAHVSGTSSGESLLRSGKDTWTLNPSPSPNACPLIQ